MLSLSPPRTRRGEKPPDFAHLPARREGAKFKDNPVFILDAVGNFGQALTLGLFI